MKLTWKLSLAVGLGVLVVLTGHAALRVHRDVVRFRQSVRDNHQVVGRLLAATLEEMRASDARAHALVARLGEREPSMHIDWREVSASEEGSLPGVFHAANVPGPEGTELLVSTTTLQVPGRPVTVIEIVEPLDREAEYAREAILRTATTTCIVLLLCVSIILVFGVLFVGRPLEALRRHARRAGREEKGIQTPVASNDEIGDLAREMNTMTALLDQARVRARAEEAARIDTLAQLRQADRLRVIGELASSVAHDLGTPMGTVSARAQMIANGEVSDGRARELAAAIVDEISAMTSSMRQLLDYGRREEPRRVGVELLSWAASVVDLVRPLAERREVAIHLHCDTPALRVEMDPAQMRHVLVNLVGNAVDASPERASIEVAIEASDDEARLLVRDHGPGIAPGRLATIFEPFFSTKAPSEGSGLGLSIARGIVEEHGGRLTARAATGGGSVFEVALPLDRDALI